MAVLSVSNVYKDFGNSHILKGVDLELSQGEQCVIKGSSGCGKSTLLYLIGGLENITSGQITVDNLNIGQMNDAKLANYRNSKIGFVFQFHFLLSSLTCLENILLPARLGGHDVSNVKKYIHSLAKTLGVAECLKRYPYEISGGQQQRINLIRALSLRPKLLLCDEPTGNLDSKNSKIVADLIFELSRELGTTLLVVTHDEEMSRKFSRIHTMIDGVLH
ncbi:ABC transporter, ATP-binding protein [Bacteriovorax sp. BAL6_X]|uniref:ABC transporter ATP-binding protein n=1 Tax=Bacteriovorax sp. BAL6_X TaxID=1201290 RepID=UPI0003855C2B|nr:ABC transporter ATP-binding protein [Bacteriovorax sp. BAL6_X]EPZ49701.1 ABC transporter, ATP-binding protein [Bacteriovorax sp. BAL6_X]